MLTKLAAGWLSLFAVIQMRCAGASPVGQPTYTLPSAANVLTTCELWSLQSRKGHPL